MNLGYFKHAPDWLKELVEKQGLYANPRAFAFVRMFETHPEDRPELRDRSSEMRLAVASIGDGTIHDVEQYDYTGKELWEICDFPARGAKFIYKYRIFLV